MTTNIDNLQRRLKPNIHAKVQHSEIGGPWQCVIATENNDWPHWVRFSGETSQEAIDAMIAYLDRNRPDHARNARDPSAFLLEKQA